jgi:hypothetical protein
MCPFSEDAACSSSGRRSRRIVVHADINTHNYAYDKKLFFIPPQKGRLFHYFHFFLVKTLKKIHFVDSFLSNPYTLYKMQKQFIEKKGFFLGILQKIK